MRIALDAMGGDEAPGEIIAGAVAALKNIDDDDQIILVGIEPLIKEHLDQLKKTASSSKGEVDPQSWQERLKIIHAPEVVEMDESPVEAIRKKRKSSLAVMIQMAADGEADVLISAGNTGAFVAGSQMRMGRLPGVLRPGILVVFPTFGGPVAVCDVGANIAPKASHLHQYAVMASIYMRAVMHKEEPTVGLISIGQEDAKGNEIVKSANQMMREDKRLKFVGNVEPRDFLRHPADVLISDGFVGNVILKLTEGLAEALFKTIAVELKRQKPEIIEHFKPIVEALYAKHDYIEYGGAPLLGINGTCIICHGSSNARAIEKSILTVREQLRFEINSKISEQLQSESMENSLS